VINESDINQKMLSRRPPLRPSTANRLRLILLIPVLLLPPGCGDGGGGDGFGGLGTIGGERTAGAALYVTNSGSNDVSGYTINPSTGGLGPIAGSPFKDVSTPSAIALSSDGLFAYVANRQTNKVTAFRVGTDGALLLGPSTSDNPNPVSTGTAPRALAVSRDSRLLYVANSGSDDVTVFKIGTAGVLTLVPQATGPSKPVAAGAAAPIALAVAPTGRVLYVASNTSNTITAFEVDAAGLLTLLPQAGPGTNPISVNGTGLTALAITPNGKFLYAISSTSNHVTAFQIESSGLLTLIAPTSSNPISTGGTTPNGITIQPNGTHLYIANGGGNVSAFTIGSNGLLTAVPSSGTAQNPTPTVGSTPVALTISQEGQSLSLYVANREGTVLAYTIVSGSGTLVPLTPLVGNPFRTGTTPSAIAALNPTS
jgi:6-phosphogluconolactonase